MSATAHILPADITLAQAIQQAVEARLHLVITREGHSTLVPQVLPGMVRICSCDKQLEAA